MARFNFFFLWLSNSLLSYHLFTVFAYYIFCFLFLLVCLTSVRAEVLFDSLLYFHLTARRFLQNLPLHWVGRALLTGQRGQEWSALQFCGDKCHWYCRGRGGFVFFFGPSPPRQGWAVSIQFIRSVVSDSLRTRGLQYARLPCPSPTPWASSNSFWVGDAIQPSHPLSSPSPLPSIFPSIKVFLNESALQIRWPKNWSFSFNITPSNEYSGLLFFRMDWLDLLAVQGTLKSLLQHHSSKASILQHSTFFIAQLSYPYMTTGKTIAFKMDLSW